MDTLPFTDRSTAGRRLAEQLMHCRNRKNFWVLALPRGGVPVAYEIAVALHLPLDVMVVRKLGLPGHKEYAMGAIARGGVRVINDQAVKLYHISDEVFEQVAQRELTELTRREAIYRAGRPWPALKNQAVILVDDGLATGATMSAAILTLRREDVGKLILAVPVGAPRTIKELAKLVDEVICPVTPHPFVSVGQWYAHFPQTSDDEVQRLLAQARSHYDGGSTQSVYHSISPRHSGN